MKEEGNELKRGNFKGIMEAQMRLIEIHSESRKQLRLGKGFKWN